jgi:hypothetical protein
MSARLCGVPLSRRLADVLLRTRRSAAAAAVLAPFFQRGRQAFVPALEPVRVGPGLWLGLNLALVVVSWPVLIPCLALLRFDWLNGAALRCLTF